MARLQRVDDDEASHASHTTATSAGGADPSRRRVRPPRRRRVAPRVRADEPLGMELEFDSGGDRILVHRVHAGSQATACAALEDGMVLASLSGAPCRNLDEFEPLPPGARRGRPIVIDDGARGGLRRRATIPPFGAIVEAATTMEHWLLVFAGPGEAPPAPDAPALGVGGAVQSTHGAASSGSPRTAC
ncbi:hypothetical protein JL720_12882 [Aureococcus anophagefferens]|nr:hypothetical protein JL720_12882 [Aureococcus anophagefferens]